MAVGSIEGVERGAGVLRVRSVTTAADLRALRETWDEVFAAAATRTPFLAHDWVLAWWESFGEGLELAVLVLEDELGVAGIAPLTRARRRIGPLSYRSLELLGTGPLLFLGMGLADRADFLFRRRHEECLGAVVSWLSQERRHWDAVDLRFVPDDSITALHIRDLARDAGLGHAATTCAMSPYLRLEGTWDDYLAQRGRSFRKGLKRRLRKLEALGEVRFDLAAERRGALEMLDRVIATSLASWKQEAGSALFQHANVRAFFRRAVPDLAARGGLFIAVCEVAGEVAAHELGFRMDGKLWSYDSAYAAAFAAGSPGVVLTARLLEDGIEEGLSEYDFLRGDEGYKHDWTTGSRRELQIVLDSGAVRARLARRLAYEGKWSLKARPRLVELQQRLGGAINRFRDRRSS